VQRTLDDVFRGFEPPNLDAELATLQLQRATVEQKIARLTSAIEAGGGLEPLIAQLRVRQQEREDLLVRIATNEGNKLANIDRSKVEARVDARLDVWRKVLVDQVENGTMRRRQLLREVLTGPLGFTPDGKGYTFRAPSAVGEVMAGAVADAVRAVSVKTMRGVGRAHKVASPGGYAIRWKSKAVWPASEVRGAAA
jgi:hypothetical protein